ncbi:MAG: glycosyltransferase family protein [Desulfarculus sp.]|nr:glycosyltransferase family protein [Desulfarculus sp.]
MRTIATIEARMRSTRLPGKVLLPILGRPMLELMIERLNRVRGLDGVVIATSEDPSCQPIAELAARLGVGCHRGSEDDVLTRVLEAARSMRAERIVQTTGDCPLVDPATVEAVLALHDQGRGDFCANMLTRELAPLPSGQEPFPARRTYPVGLDVRVFRLADLEEVARLSTDPVDHEHVSNYFWEHPERFRLANLDGGLPDWARELRLTVDTAEDFSLINSIFEELYPTKPDFSLAEVLDLLARRPELADLNRHVVQKGVR